ncbi:putative Transmembrane protein [Quillaja saponaria]|uniref:Transmembrane protein n=1 Tax=Quillaja saponaria TaxID=32244 RepID=A0AAD7LQF7_QUISA|nr:putative Transmembrane protein [Quillaja saponaria]
MVSLPNSRVLQGCGPDREHAITITYISANPEVFLRDSESSVPWFAVFVFLIPVLGGFLQLHCQGSNSSPFITHQANMWACLLAVIIFCSSSAYCIKSRFHTTNYAKLAAQINLIAGSLASVSAKSILVPSQLERLVYIVWIPLPIFVVGRSFILRIGQHMYQGSKIAILQTWKRIVGSKNTEEQPQSPV